MRKSIRRVFWLYTLLFLLLIFYLLKITLKDSKNYILNPMNPRLSSKAEDIKRGTIYDNNGTEIAHSEQTENGFERLYKTEGNYSSVIGYTENGMSGVEAGYNFNLESIDAELLQRISAIFTKEPVKGNDIYLTIDDRVQCAAANALNGAKGSVVAMEPNTGRILAMASNPTFDSNTVVEDWDYLTQNEEDSPLINRATQGLYPPGSVFKIITTAAALSANENNEDFEYTCNGYEQFGDTVMKCFEGYAHGTERMENAFAQSCNTYYATIAEHIGSAKLMQTANNFGFNSPVDFPLSHETPRFALDETSQLNELSETAIGQGKTLVTPLFMVMIASAVANDGVMMKPYILDRVVTCYGIQKQKTIPEIKARVCTPEIAQKINEFMCACVSNGTGTGADFYAALPDNSVSGSSVYVGEQHITVAGKTGTAENSSGEDHSWFVCFAPAQNPKIAVAVLLENSGHGDSAEYIAADVMKTYLEIK